MKGATSIQERLWELRKDKGLNLEELSELTGISKSALGSYEKEDYKEIQQAKTHLAGADNRDQLFELGHLSRVGCLVPQHSYMVRQAATVNIVRPFTQEVEHLRKSKRH